jgi:hypothetical protein
LFRVKLPPVLELEYRSAVRGFKPGGQHGDMSAGHILMGYMVLADQIKKSNSSSG